MMMLKPRLRTARAAPAAQAAQAAHAAPVQALQAQPAALQQAGNFSTLLGHAVARQAGNGVATAAMAQVALQPGTGAELLELQLAVIERTRQMQQGWWQAWGAWLEGFGQLRRASTMSEHLEQQYNIAEQATALLKDQAGDLMDLQESIEVNYGYWLARKMDAAQGPRQPGPARLPPPST